MIKEYLLFNIKGWNNPNTVYIANMLYYTVIGLYDASWVKFMINYCYVMMMC